MPVSPALSMAGRARRRSPGSHGRAQPLPLYLAVVLPVLLLATSACGADGTDKPRLTPQMVENLAVSEAFQTGSRVGIGCKVLEFRDNSRTWLVECIQISKTRWVVDDQTEEIRLVESASESPGRTPN